MGLKERAPSRLPAIEREEEEEEEVPLAVLSIV